MGASLCRRDDSTDAEAFPEAKGQVGPLSKESFIVLKRSGVKMPVFGLGTWLAKPEDLAVEACLAAWKDGYKMIDTAALYENEEAIGKALKEIKANRSEYFIVTKLHCDRHGFQQAIDELKVSCAKLGLKYVDLFLIHSPKGGKVIETWKGLIEAKKMGLTRAIGVSNFGVEHLKQLNKHKLEMPDVNQIELHVWNHQNESVAYMDEEGIAVMGYCPLARVKRFGETCVSKVAKDLKKTEAQIAIRWSLQKGIITIPKSTNKKRIRENGDVFGWNIPDGIMKTLDDAHEGFQASNSVNNMKLPWKEVK